MRLYKEDRISMIVLEAAEAANVAVGAGSISIILTKNGIRISEAGTGRILRSLREQGLLKKEGFRGHSITPSGSKKLAALKTAEETAETLKRLMSRSENLKGHSITEILTVRKAIEREAAFQAAHNASPEDIIRLEQIVDNQYMEMKRKSYYADISAEFHQEILRIAHVPLLNIMYEFIGLSVEWQNFFIETFRILDTPLNVPHERILEAIKRKDPSEAAKLMDIHLTDVIENVKSFSDKV